MWERPRTGLALLSSRESAEAVGEKSARQRHSSVAFRGSRLLTDLDDHIKSTAWRCRGVGAARVRAEDANFKYPTFVVHTYCPPVCLFERPWPCMPPIHVTNVAGQANRLLYIARSGDVGRFCLRTVGSVITAVWELGGAHCSGADTCGRAMPDGGAVSKRQGRHRP